MNVGELKVSMWVAWWCVEAMWVDFDEVRLHR